MKKLSVCIGLLFLLNASAFAENNVKRYKGEDLSAGIIDALDLVNKKIMVSDFMGEINNNFTPYETKRSIRGPYYTKFNLRDSKLRCIVSKYDRKNYDFVKTTREDSRVTVVGRIEQLAFGIERFSNPYYILRVDHFEPGWCLDESEDIFSGFSRDTRYLNLTMQDFTARPEKYAGEFLKIMDRFSVRSTFFTQYERDLNLTDDRVIKFYLENSGWPYYMISNETNAELLDKLAPGDPLTVSGRLNLIPFRDDALILFSVSKLKIGW